MTEDGKEFYCQSNEYITAEHTRKFILTLSDEFDDDLLVVLDGEPYFRASKMSELAD